MVRRYAFTMIELILAIVIIAITVMSLPMMSQVTAVTSANNIEADEAIFEAYVKAMEATDETFASLGNVSTTSVLDDNASGSLAGLKFAYKYSISVTTPAEFETGTGADTNIKKVTVTIYDEDGNVITRLHTYKFNM